jgi:hypothetical protein
MKESDAAEILLVRAVEEHDPELITDAAQAAAFARAGNCEDVAAWFGRRASSLIGRLPHPDLYRSILKIPRLPDRYASAVLLVTLAVGLISNHFGPARKIHVLFNPVTALVVWNLCLYLLLILRMARRLTGSPESEPPSTGIPRDEREHRPGGSDQAPEARAQYGHLEIPWLLRLASAEGIWRKWLWWRDRYAEARARGDDFRRAAIVAARFCSRWFYTTRNLTTLRLERLFHLGALGLIIGAIAGMYVRGLFFDYNVVWRSTFIRSEHAIATLLNVVLGPAAALLGIDTSTEFDVGRLMSESGVPAATSIHLYAFTALLVIILPRSLFCAIDSLRIRALRSRVTLDFGDDYFQSRLHLWHESRRRGIIAEIRAAYLVEAQKLAGNVSDYVCAELYDRSIASQIEGFRENGGRLIDLERSIEAAAEGFTAQLGEYVRKAQSDFEKGFAASVTVIVGKELGPSISSGRTIDGEAVGDSAGTSASLVDSIGQGVADAISVAVSAAVAVALGTLSGGFGKALGVAVLVGVVHSGPLAFLIGAIAGLVAMGAGFWLGREALTAAVKEYHVPSRLARSILWKSRMRRIIEQGRAKTRDSVKTQIEEAVQPLADDVASGVWRRIELSINDSRNRSASR